MSVYFGNGYFLNIVQRGAAPVGKARASLPQAPVAVEETVVASSHAAAEVSPQTFAVQPEPLAPQTTPIATQPLQDDPLTESPHVAAPVSPLVDLRENVSLETTARPAPEARATPSAELTEPIHSSVSVAASEPAAPASFEVSATRAFDPPFQTVARESPVSIEMSRAERTSSRVFELKMPENFFGQPRVETTQTSQIKPAHIFSAVPEPQTQTQPVEPRVSEPPVSLNIPTDTQAHSVVIPEPANTPGEIQTIELRQPGPTKETQATAPVENDVVAHVSVPPSRVLAVEITEPSNAKTRVEQTSEHLQPRQRSLAPAPVAPPARLHINRVDIQVINQVPPSPPAAHVPDVSQLLEKKHLGRVELLL